MDFGSALITFGLDLELLQGIVNHLYESDPSLQIIETENGGLRLELDAPQIETRQDGSFRMGVHLTGRLFVGQDDEEPRLIDAWVRLRTEVVTGADSFPAGGVRFDEVEDCIPAIIRPLVTRVFEPEGFIGKVLASLSIPVFKDLLESANEQLNPPDTPLELSAFATTFYLGRPAAIRRPLYMLKKVDESWEPEIDLDITYATVPALVAAVGLAGSDPTPPGAPSVVRPGTGLTLVTTASLFQARFERESEAIKGTTLSGLTIDRFEAVSTDWGFDVEGEGHKTGAEVDFAGSLLVQFRGGVGGELRMTSTVETDVDTAWWVDLLSVVAAIVPGLGWFLGDIFIWSPTQAAPGKVEAALLEKFGTPLADAAAKVANSFGIEDIPTSALLADVWFFDGNLAVAAAAFAGRLTAEVQSVSRDVSYLAKAPTGTGKHTNRRRPVVSVGAITFSTAHTLKPWQAGQLVKDGILRVPGHHAVSSPLAKNGVYLRSNPDDTNSNNLLS